MTTIEQEKTDYETHALVATLDRVVTALENDIKAINDVMGIVDLGGYSSELLEQVAFDVLNNSNKTGHLRYALGQARRIDQRRAEANVL